MAFKMNGFSGFKQKEKGKSTDAKANPNIGANLAKHKIWTEDGGVTTNYNCNTTGENDAGEAVSLVGCCSSFTQPFSVSV